MTRGTLAWLALAACSSSTPIASATDTIDVLESAHIAPSRTLHRADGTMEVVAVVELADRQVEPAPTLAIADVVVAPVEVQVVEPAPVEPTTYLLDDGRSWLYVLVRYDRGALIKGHDHGVRATAFDGRVTWHPSDPDACDVRITVPVTALSADTAGLRDRLGLEGETDERDVRKINENIFSKRQLWADAFGDITYQSVSCSGTHGEVEVTGDLTIRGVSKRITTTLYITEDGERFRARGHFGATHADFGFDPFTAALGGLRNDEALSFHLDVVGTPGS